jgi:hypothetical protein
MDKTDLRDEYLDVSDNIPHWNTLRFAGLTIHIALTGALPNAIIGKSPPLPPLVSAPGKIAGLIVTIGFFVLQERTMLYWYSFLHRVKRKLGFQQYSTRPPAGITTTTSRNAMRAFFLIMVLFWVISLFWFPAWDSRTLLGVSTPWRLDFVSRTADSSSSRHDLLSRPSTRDCQVLRGTSRAPSVSRFALPKSTHCLAALAV